MSKKYSVLNLHPSQDRARSRHGAAPGRRELEREVEQDLSTVFPQAFPYFGTAIERVNSIIFSLVSEEGGREDALAATELWLAHDFFIVRQGVPLTLRRQRR